VQVKDTNKALALMANYFEDPSKDLKLVGITGTNGKTTIASLLYQLFKRQVLGGIVHAVKILVDNTEYKTMHTTPDSITINHYLSEMVKEGLNIVYGGELTEFTKKERKDYSLLVVFTNLSHDHLTIIPLWVEMKIFR
jgi:UDP-N-acetylmuramoyl-L-alanyl-D-glutamate--2,6-diaminopimelate ligase